ncbi:MAG: hypothetical protein ACHQQ3_08235 [Gemmatimonadales bacterium]
MPQFSRSIVPTISFVNLAKEPLDADLGEMVAALQRYVDDCLAPVWGTPATLRVAKHVPKGHWGVVFTDGYHQATTDGVHDLTQDGYPLANVYVSTVLKAKEKVSLTVSHELAEMLVDPGANIDVEGPRNVLYSYEVADPVEEDKFLVDGFQMSDFVFPAWFEGFHKPHSTQFDYMKKLSRPFQVRRTGYALVLYHGRWIYRTITPAKLRRLEEEDRRGHRSTLRPHRHRRKRSRCI